VFFHREAGHHVVAALLHEARRLGAAAFACMAAARGKGAAAAQLVRGRHQARNLREPRARGVHRGHRGHQRAGVGVQRAVEQVDHVGLFHLLAGVHHHHAVAALGHHAQVVRDHHHAHAQLLLQALDELEDLRLDGHVQRGGRLVGDQHLGVAGQGQRDHHALAHAAGELVRVLVHAALGLGDLHHAQHFHGALHRIGAAGLLVQLHRLGDLPAHGEHRVQRGHRLLEDHGDAVAANLAHLALAQLHQVGAAQPHGARVTPRRRGHQPQDRQRGHALAAARFADHAQRAAGAHRVGNPVDRTHHAGQRVEVGAQVVDFEQRLAGGEGGVGHRGRGRGHGALLTVAAPGAGRAHRAVRRPAG
jgi:hypothetical protein